MRKTTFLMLIVTLVTFSLHAQTNFMDPGNTASNRMASQKTSNEVVIKKQNTVPVKSTLLFHETFSDGSLPTGWINVDNTGNSAGIWLFDNPADREVYTSTGATGFAIFDSDYLGNDGLAEDADLITPAIDCSTLSTAILSFEHFFNFIAGSAAEVFVSGDNGVTWTSLETWSTTTTNAAVAKYDISSVAAGQSEVKVRWNYQGAFSWYWAIDDVIVGEATDHDLAVQSINAVSPVFCGDTISPTVTILNSGEFNEDSYSVTLTDGISYSETLSISDNILVGETNTVTLPDWIPTHDGTNTLTATVTCPDDAVANNDELTKAVSASQHEKDLGVTSINVASEVLSTAVISPTVTILNSGSNEVASYSVLLTDGDTYSDTVDVTTTIAVGTEYTVTFSDWTPAVGNYTLSAKVTATNDINGHNNNLNKDISVSDPVHDLALSSINVDSALLSPVAISPTVTILNTGDYEETTYSVLLSDGNSYSETVDVATAIAIEAESTITFPEWTPVVGEYTLTATVTVTDDADTINNVQTLELVVSVPQHDLAVLAVLDVAAIGTSTPPYVTILNNGDFSETSYSVSLSNGSDYNETINSVTPIDIGASSKIVFPNWTPADTANTLTAVVTVTDDANTDNDTLAQECKLLTERMAFVSIYNSGSRSGTLNIPFDNYTEIGASPEQLQSFGWKDNVLYAITYTGQLGSVNTADGAFKLIGNTGISANFFTSLVCDPITGELYVTTLTGGYPGFNLSIYSIDPKTGAGTLVATSPQTGTFAYFSFNGEGQLYCIEHRPGLNGLFYAVDKATAEMTLIGDLGDIVSANFQSMSWDVYNEVMYFQASASDGSMQGSYVMNLSTGAATLVGTPTTLQVLAMELPVWDANLLDLRVDGTTVEGFSPETYDYSIVLPSGTAAFPVVDATPFYSSADTTVTNITEFPDTATVVVTPPEGESNTYTIYFSVAADSNATLTDLRVDGATIADFDPLTMAYSVELPTGTSIVPTVTATTYDGNATYIVADSIALPSISSVEVTAADGTTTQTYTISFSVAPNNDATLSDLLIDEATVQGFNPLTLTYDVLFPSGTSGLPTVSAILNDTNATMVITNITEFPGTATVAVTAEDDTTQQTYAISFSMAANNDATLSDLIVKDTTVVGFDPATLIYEVILPSGTNNIPIVYATTYDANATLEVTNATALPGASSIVVTAADGSTQQTYSINFTVAEMNDASLADLTVNGETVADFASATYSYDVVLPFGTTTVPVVTATTTDSRALITELIDAPSLPGATTVSIEANDGITILTYTINFTLASIDATLSDLTVDGSTVDGFSASTYSYDVELPSGTTVVPTVTASATDDNASAEITPAAALPGSTTVLVTAQDGNTLTYSVNFIVLTTGIDELDEQSLRIYPNPAVDVITVKLNTLITQVEILNINGQVVLQSEVNNYEGSINTSGLMEGSYLVRIATSNTVITKRVQIER